MSYARGGESNHNFAFAVDIFRIDGGVLCNPDATTVSIFKGLGFAWGGDWPGKKADKPRFQRVPSKQ
ncbi:M15 family metallopeptidase [Undibacterium sp. TJN25]|uniref:M15 family metallopeptidase n=1 Tax=Undibacterium sp. TJN25 TaxID=3413056 RepID=UPI003BF39A80